MSDEYAIRPTDEELAGWADPEGEAGLYFPEYFEERHYELLEGMFEELIESRAVIARVEQLAARRRDSASTFYTSDHQTARDIDAALEGGQ